MEKIRLPEDFTDRVMQKIEQRERAAARRIHIITVCGSILGAVFVIAAAVAVLDYFNISLNSLTIDLPRLDIPGAVSGFISSVSDIMRKVITTPSSPLLGIVLAVFTLAFAGLWHDRRHRQDITTSVK